MADAIVDFTPAPPRSSAAQSVVPGLLMLFGWAIWALTKHWDHWPPDLSALYFAAHFFAEGSYAEVYASPAEFFGTDYPQSWAAAVTAYGHTGEVTFPYIYPPLWAALLSPVVQFMGPQTFFNGVYVWHLTLMALMPWLAYRLLRPAIGFSLYAVISVALLSTSLISIQALFQNQQQITVAFLMLLAFERVSRGQQTAGGIALGLAAAMKLSPILLLLLFMSERKWRASGVALATVALLAALSFAIAGPDLHWIYRQKLELLSDRLAIVNFNFSARSAIFQLWEFVNGRTMPSASGGVLALPAPAWLNVVLTLLLAGSLAAIFWLSQHADPERRLRNRFAATVLVVTVCGPLAWGHHYVLPLAMLPALVGTLSPVTGWLIVAAFGAYFSYLSLVYVPGLLAPYDFFVPVAVLALFSIAFICARAGSVRTAP